MGSGQAMISLLSLVLAATDPAASPAPKPDAIVTFHTKKSLADLEKCLTDKLSPLGEVTSVPIEDAKTLMFSTTDEPPMMIDIAPPLVKVTTKFAIGTQPIVKACL